MHLFKKKQTSRIYFDYASATPPDKTMERSYVPLAPEILGANPGSLHAEGVTAKRALHEARKVVGDVLSAHADEIIFTSGATESNSLAIIGVIESLKNRERAYSDMHIVASAVEHPSVYESLEELKRRGVQITYIIPTEQGIVTASSIKNALSEKTVLVTCTYVQNEMGTVQPLKEIAKAIREWKSTHQNQEIIFHTDATQAASFLPLNVLQLHVDLLTLGSTKLYAERGVGVLFRKRGTALQKIHFGGNQEFGLRPGTVSLNLVHRFAFALHYARELLPQEEIRLRELQQYFETKLQKEISASTVTGKDVSRVPFISHVTLNTLESELLVIELNARGIALSSKSACKSDDPNISSIVSFLFPNEPVRAALRFSFGRTTTKADCDRAITALVDVLTKYKK